MALLLVAVEYSEGHFFEDIEVYAPHFISYHIEHAPNVRMLVIVLSQPSQPFVNSDDEVVQVIIAPRIVKGKLFVQLLPEEFAFLLAEQVVEGEQNLLNV